MTAVKGGHVPEVDLTLDTGGASGATRTLILSDQFAQLLAELLLMRDVHAKRIADGLAADHEYQLSYQLQEASDWMVKLLTWAERTAPPKKVVTPAGDS
jgi:hypothetical protein